MSPPKKPSAINLWKAIQEQAAADDVNEITSMSDAELDAYISANGGDPAKIAADGEALAKRLLAERDERAKRRLN